MKTNDFGIDLIKQFEGLVDGDPNTPGLDPYICPTGFVTIGYGHVIRDTDGKMLRGRAGLQRAKEVQKAITHEEAETLLGQDIETFEADVIRLTRNVELNTNQFSALVSFTFNVGITAFERSTLRRLLLNGDFTGAANEFPKWNKGDTNGDGIRETLPGLVRRREAERQLFLRPVKPLTRSRQVLASAGVIAATTASVVAEVAVELKAADTAVQATGTELDILKYALAVCAVLGAVFTIFARVSDRVKKGV